MTYTIDTHVHEDLIDTVEDAVAYICDEYMISGELAWVIVESLAEAKIAQLQGECD